MENEYIRNLEELAKVKKKYDAPKEKRTLFYNNWLKLAKNDGFNSTSEYYFYECLAFCGAEPLKQYISESDDPNRALDEFFYGKKYSENNSKTFRILTHLLALFLNSGDNPEIVSKLIKKFSIGCKSKENKLLGDAKKTVEIYFLKVLNKNVNLMPLSALNIESSTAEKFVKIMTECILGSNSPNVSKVKAWLNNSTEENLPRVLESPIIPEDTTEKPTPIISASTMLSQVLEKVLEIEKQNEQYKNENEQLKDDKAKLQQLLIEERAKLQSSLQKIEELEKNLDSIKVEISQKDEIIIKQAEEIANRIQMEKFLSEEQDHQAIVALQKIASKLQVEYQDFKTALNTPMCDDLGENFRDQLKNIFKDLESCGVKFK